jgi:hypothetical protein
MEFITAEEFKKVSEGDLGTMNLVLDRLYNKAVESAIQATPMVTAQLIKTSMGMKKMTDKFFADNPNFAGHEDVVKEMVRQTEIANPADTYEQVLTKAVPAINTKIVKI